MNQGILYTIFLLSLLICSIQAQQQLNIQKINLKQKTSGHRVFIDDVGRERIFHGVNVIVKGPPWVPDVSTFSVDISLTDRDFQIMQQLGLNVIRLGTMWPGVEPARTQYNDTYLELLQNITEKAASYGIYTLLDMHQDVLSEQFCGEGIPQWAVKTDGTFADKIFDDFPAPVLPQFTQKDAYGFPVRQDCAKQSWPNYYTSERTASAFQALWKNVDGVRDAWAAMWQRVATQFKDSAQILGLELMNEPFPGNFYSKPWVMVPIFPLSGDFLNMQEAYDEIANSVREVNEDVLIFFAGATWDDFGVNFEHPPGGKKHNDKSVIAYHYYSPPQVSPDYLQKTNFQFIMQMNKAKKLQTGSMLTETCDPSCTEQFGGKGGVADAADVFLQSWATWEWKSFCRESNETLSGESQWAEFGACKTGYGPVWDENTQMPPKYQEYARTYAKAVSGSITQMHFDVDTKEFNLYFNIDTTISLPTEIYVSPEYNYQNGVFVVAEPQNSVTIQYDQSKRLVIVSATDSAVYGEQIHIIITNQQSFNSKNTFLS